MRFYKLRVFDAAAQAAYQAEVASLVETAPSALTNSSSYASPKPKPPPDLLNYSSLNADGSMNTGALNIELDIPLTAFDVVAGAAYVKIWGIGLKTIGQSQNLNGKNIEISVGMSQGLPLANPNQHGSPFSGKIFQAFGNWQGVNQTLDLVFYASYGTTTAVARALDDPQLGPANIVFDWQPNQPMSEAVANALNVAFPNNKQSIAISPNLVVPASEPSFHGTLQSLASHLKERSLAIIKTPGYSGVTVAVTNSNIIQVYDGSGGGSDSSTAVSGGGSGGSGATTIAFTDLIGQPTWLNLQTIQFFCVMRGDLHVGDYVKLPQTQVTTTTASMSQFRNNLTFQGTFQIIELRLVGNFRQPTAEAWVTVVNGILKDPPA